MKEDLILSLDPGPEQTGWCEYEPGTHKLQDSGVWANEHAIVKVRVGRFSHLAIEMIASYGMPVGADVFETCLWIGRFIEAAPIKPAVELVFRKDVKMHLCGNTQAKDANIRQAILDQFARTGGGATPQVGTKKQPGPLYGVSTHAWAALGVALTSRAGRAGNKVAA
ncbi:MULTISPECIES: hypothetical protein [unclassified Achromobacter]|uniref:hypothetical protein n=1 Tax=unclassified Achromobacter TaxID=2626865 RepID=UPI000B5182C0|nr:MULTISPECIES: hypothetical protein [unclassified Achromobacter]OWT69226.1 hypothetical protein CEY05_28810 [Achromobacter sp. HZ34]OWT70631.1 hypothetical protein CEY04_27640 [Achromobacter sp. HZ28]